MASPYVGEIRMFGGNFAPAGWAFCSGQLLPISENDVLFNLIGTTYGGDGQETFALPNLQSRVPMHVGNGTTIGEAAGTETVTLTTQQMPQHTHVLAAGGGGANSTDPTNNVVAKPSKNLYRPGPASVAMDPTAVTVAGGNQPHDNMQPYVGINFIISLYGIYPSPN